MTDIEIKKALNQILTIDGIGKSRKAELLKKLLVSGVCISRYLGK